MAQLGRSLKPTAIAALRRVELVPCEALRLRKLSAAPQHLTAQPEARPVGCTMPQLVSRATVSGAQKHGAAGRKGVGGMHDADGRAVSLT